MRARNRGLAARVAALEDGRPGRWLFTLDDGRTVAVPLEEVLQVFGVGLAICDGQDAEPPKYLGLLSRAVSTQEQSLLGKSVIEVARQARAERGADAS